MVIAGAAQIGVIEERGLTAAFRGGPVVLAGAERGDALAGERAEFNGAGRNRFGARRIDAAIKPQDSKAGAKTLFGMLSAGEHGGDQPLGVGPDLAGPAAEPVRRPLGVTPVGSGHVIGIGAVPGAHVTTRVDADAPAAMEYLDRAGGDAHIDFGADQRMRNRI